MGLGGLFRNGLVERATSMTYQAASGGGARHMREALRQFGTSTAPWPSSCPIRRPRSCTPTAPRRPPSAAGSWTPPSLECPWPGSPSPGSTRTSGNGQSREGWKAEAETKKILGRSGTPLTPVDGLCVRIAAMRSHLRRRSPSSCARRSPCRDSVAPDEDNVATRGAQHQGGTRLGTSPPWPPPVRCRSPWSHS
ncbi:Asd/ArgC dimerization domain-containing protein [Kocuria rhizophila]|nr:Asd/ArgC dimerization domain-containing protein [Kocuria rhizophila]